MSDVDGTRRRFYEAAREIHDTGRFETHSDLTVADGVETWANTWTLPDGRRVLVIQRFPEDDREDALEDCGRVLDGADWATVWWVGHVVAYTEMDRRASTGCGCEGAKASRDRGAPPRKTF